MSRGSEREPGFRETFYSGWPWRRCRSAYAKKVIYCERCAARGLTVPGVDVHHKIRLTPENVKDESVALNWANLELLCEDCHRDEHTIRRYRADESGHIELPPSK